MPDDSCPTSTTGYPSDCDVTQGLLKRAMGRETPPERGYVWRSCLPKAKLIKLLLLDVDGILTDGTITYTHEGTEIKSFHTRDGLGIRLLQEAGVEVGIITARTSEAVKRRAEDLKLAHVYQGCRNKIVAYEEIRAKVNLRDTEVAYMGDDWLDLPLLTRVGFSASVIDGVHEVRQVVDYVTTLPGGRGAVREVCDLLIAARGKQEEMLGRYLR